MTSGTHVYDNGTNVTIEAIEVTEEFQYIQVDNTTHTTKTVTVTMNSDHQVSASFRLPMLTIYTTEPDTYILPYGPYGTSYTTDSRGYLTLGLPFGNYTLEAEKDGYYSVTQSITLDGDRSTDIQMKKILYIAPTVHITPNDVYILPFMPQDYSTSDLDAEIDYFGNWTAIWYVDPHDLIYVQPAASIKESAHATIRVTVHYGTDYPIIEIESSNMAIVGFVNLTELYENYWHESYLEKVEHTQFTGFKLDSKVPVAYEFGMPEPKELWETTPEGTMTKLTDWTYENGSVMLNFGPGDATISMIFGDNSTNYHNPLAAPALEAISDVEPHMLNLGSKSEWVTAYIELPKGYDVSDVDVSSIMMNNTVSLAPGALTSIGDYNNNKIPDLMVEFNRAAVAEFIRSEGLTTGNVTLTVTGNLIDENFRGSAVITVRMPGDVNVDGKVDGKDIALAAVAFGSCPRDPRWNCVVDENEDNKIDGKDIVLIALNFGKA